MATVVRNPDAKQRIRRIVKWSVLGAFLLFIVLPFGLNSLTCVEAGHVGVTTLFGAVKDSLPEGIHVINPLKSVHRMSVRTQEIKEKAAVPSQEGLVLGLDVSLLYHLRPTAAAQAYKDVGPNYASVVVEPTLRAAIRSTTSAHPANALYSGERDKVALQIQTELEHALTPRGVVVEKVLLRDVQLPQVVAAAIQQKQQAEQESLAMQFKLQKETQEAERKRIEASGVRDFQRIVSQGISEQLLQWKGIEATEHLAKSQNAKIVVIGSGKNGLPVILGQ